MGELAAFSFFPTKPLGGCGDGGLVVTRDPTLAERCRAIRSHGRTSEGTFELVGGNYRLDALQAALLRVRLGHVDDWQHRRRANAEFYRQHLAECTGVFLPPTDEATNVSAWSVFAVRVPERRHALRQFLAARGIETAVYYPTAAHLQPALGQNRGRPGQYPIAERLTRELLALPVGPELAPEQRDYVVESVTRFFSNHSAVAPQ
jgi:dTDP-4-amino-4,6-dideoxygalactose transaminase